MNDPTISQRSLTKKHHFIHSPHTQTEGPLHCLAVSQQKAAIMSVPLQQPFCGLASNSPVVDGPDQRPFPFHVDSEAATHLCLTGEGAADCKQQQTSVWKATKQEKLFWFSHFSVMHLQLKAMHFLTWIIALREWKHTSVFLFLILCIKKNWENANETLFT